MESRFQGESLNKVDGKGRISLPAKFRRALQAGDSRSGPGGAARLYIAYGNPTTDFVECLSGDYYDDLVARIEAMDDGESERELLEYLYFVKCDEVSVDETGRFVLPTAARDKLALDGDALFQGKGRKFHILKPADGQAADDKIMKMLEKFGEGKEFFNPVSLANRRRADMADADET
ncbi:cell division/cell wall cluster transcriptional repressor MraZ [Roseibacterium sp. SDUM158017]|uniref:division/cell wall cluster transcriptional repressor MraZ n=1 Tax=Roseicyclus salinarum TaxID=3036773 RepID=UPI0024154674|nr:cell division/cell wall cluster transcriptional repressor MraZ [Roseibacterium sp. SDUM158017]MDG4647701.1 cell division/cell wall cluster transcriptional repressor MraZ [Roseibacterium sp. SDUM158017]